MFASYIVDPVGGRPQVTVLADHEAGTEPSRNETLLAAGTRRSVLEYPVAGISTCSTSFKVVQADRADRVCY